MKLSTENVQYLYMNIAFQKFKMIFLVKFFTVYSSEIREQNLKIGIPIAYPS